MDSKYKISPRDAHIVEEMYENYGRLSASLLMRRLTITFHKADWLAKNIHTEEQLKKITYT